MKTLEQLGISKTQSSRWQQLAGRDASRAFTLKAREAARSGQNTNAQPGGLPSP